MMMGPGGAGRFQPPVTKKDDDDIPIMGPGASRFQPPVASKPTIGTINSGL